MSGLQSKDVEQGGWVAACTTSVFMPDLQYGDEQPDHSPESPRPRVAWAFTTNKTQYVLNRMNRARLRLITHITHTWVHVVHVLHSAQWKRVFSSAPVVLAILLVVFIFVMIASALQGELRDIGAVASHPEGDGATDTQADVHTLDDTMDAVEHAQLWMQADLKRLCRYYPSFNFMAYRRVKGTQEVVMAFDPRVSSHTYDWRNSIWWTNEGSYVTWLDHFHLQCPRPGKMGAQLLNQLYFEYTTQEFNRARAATQSVQRKKHLQTPAPTVLTTDLDVSTAHCIQQELLTKAPKDDTTDDLTARIRASFHKVECM